MRFAYADPPYVGMAHRYGEEEIDQAALLAQLDAGYDGWALSCSVPSLALLLPACPEGVRVLAWCKTWASWKRGVWPAYAWEPVLLKKLPRPADRGKVTPRDWFPCPADQSGFFGSKPVPFSFWLFRAARLDAKDEFTDLYPGSGAVGRAWELFRSQGVLVG